MLPRARAAAVVAVGLASLNNSIEIINRRRKRLVPFRLPIEIVGQWG